MGSCHTFIQTQTHRHIILKIYIFKQKYNTVFKIKEDKCQSVLKEIWNFKNVHIIRVLRKLSNKEGVESSFEQVMTENAPNLGKDTNVHILENYKHTVARMPNSSNYF